MVRISATNQALIGISLRICGFNKREGYKVGESDR